MLRNLTCPILAFMNPKQRAAEAAMAFVKSGMVVGLGTGTTAATSLIMRASIRAWANDCSRS